MSILKTVNIPKLGKKENGKVRDFYVLNDKRILITTDRISAFDRVLGYIPYKGQVLNQLSKFWFEKTKNIIPNHMIATPDPNVMVTHNCVGIPIEMIVRGYITGITGTAIWGSYAKGDRIIYGIPFPEGLKKNQKLKTPIITPTTHGDPTGGAGHDERLTREQILKSNLVTKKLYEQMEKASLELFSLGTKLAEKEGLILVDTKYEFGLYKGKLMLMDEIHTPDSSRFWIKKTYKERFSRGREPENYDKEFIRLWYKKQGYSGDGKIPPMSDYIRQKTSKRYQDIFYRFTKKRIVKTKENEKRIKQNIENYLRL